MTKFDTEIADLLEKHGSLHELSQITTYHGVREKKDGSVVEVKINIFDSGSEAGSTRYFVVVHELDNPEIQATGNPASTIDTALATLHWSDLG